MATVNIQGIDCTYRDLREGEEILYSDLPQSEQYFRRIDCPFEDDDWIDIAILPFEERKTKYNKIQLDWVEREERRMTYGNGMYASINGVVTYIPASYWGYVNYWELEHGEKPDYREADRIFFLFMEFLYFETKVLGVTRGKGRRQGATSLGFYWQWWICGRLPDKIGGSISFTEDAGKNNFSKMFMRGFRAMLPCFVRDSDSKSETFVRFVKPVEKEKKGHQKKREGLNSYVDTLSNSINAYDSGRLSFGLFDESGKYHKMNINTYWSKVSPTLKIGREKVGFAYLPTTVNPKEQGGENYRQFWNEANQNAINPETKEPYGLNTPHKMVRYLVPATEGYAGCIDKFGQSVIDDPIEPILSNKGDWITEGARTVIMQERSLKKDEQLMEHRRDFPLDEFDMFAFETGICEFNEKRLVDQLRELEANPVFLRRCRLYLDKTTKKNLLTDKEDTWNIVKYADDDAGEWLLLEAPEEQNKYDHRGLMSPLNTIRYSIGVDTIKSGFTINGSTATICVFKKSHIVDGVEKGLYPVMLYLGKPRLMQHLYEQALMACMWYGSKVNFEIDAGTQFYDFFVAKDAQKFLEWTPRVAIDVTKKNIYIKPGTESANPYQFAMQLEVAKKYFDGTLIGGYNGNVHRVKFPMMLTQALEYNHSDRTKSDIIISLMMALLPCFGSTELLQYEGLHKPKQILPQFKIKLSA
jgi:hypothetical protein